MHWCAGTLALVCRTLAQLAQAPQTQKCKIQHNKEQTNEENSRHYCAATTAIWTAANLDPWRNEPPK